jgi:hypothetical protein
MANTYILISKTILASTVASVDFTSIPSTYTDLKFVYSARSSASGGYAAHKLTFNGTAFNTNWSGKGLYGTGTSAASENWTSSDFVWSTAASATSSTFSSGEIYIPNYLSSSQKSLNADMVTENNGTTAIAYMLAGLWLNTSAINQLTLTTPSGVFEIGSSFYLYGISKS